VVNILRSTLKMKQHLSAERECSSNLPCLLQQPQEHAQNSKNQKVRNKLQWNRGSHIWTQINRHISFLKTGTVFCRSAVVYLRVYRVPEARVTLTTDIYGRDLTAPYPRRVSITFTLLVMRTSNPTTAITLFIISGLGRDKTRNDLKSIQTDVYICPICR
jgi:hypothetical protein